MSCIASLAPCGNNHQMLKILCFTLMFCSGFLTGFARAHEAATIRKGPLAGCHANSAKKVFECHEESQYSGRTWPSRAAAMKEVRGRKIASAKPVSALSTPPYKRDEWGKWADPDSDCRDTRQEILLRDNVGEVQLSPDRCKVVKGKWIDFYTGEVVLEASQVQIDHVVSVKSAHETGGFKWPRARRSHFYNDPDNLVVTSASTNASKGANDFTTWVPLKRELACDYATRWLKVKRKYELPLSTAEVTSFNLLKCQPQLEVATKVSE